MSKWKKLPGFNGEIEITKSGKIRRLYPWGYEPVGISKNARGYHIANFSFNKKQFLESVHRLVYRTFVGEIPKGMHINHKNHNPSDNRLSNLELLTPSQNSLHGNMMRKRYRNARKMTFQKKIANRQLRGPERAISGHRAAIALGMSKPTLNKYVSLGVIKYQYRIERNEGIGYLGFSISYLKQLKKYLNPRRSEQPFKDSDLIHIRKLKSNGDKVG